MATSVTVCAGSPIPFDAAEIDKKISAAHSLNTLAKTTNRVVFDLYDHCALVVRFFVVESNGEMLPVDVRGDRALASNRHAHRERAVATGDVEVVNIGRPAGFRLVAAPLHDGDHVQGVLEFVVPSEMIEPKRDHLDIVSHATSSALRAWHAATAAAYEANLVAGASFALGLRVARALMEMGELGAATRSAVQLLARELKAPVIAWRADPSGRTLRMGPSSGVGSGPRMALEARAASFDVSRDRRATIRQLAGRVAAAFNSDVTVVDGGPVVIAARGRHPELQACGHDLAALFGRLPVSSVTALDDPQLIEDVELAALRELTPRESEILALLAGGSSTRQIASRLVISDKTVKTHVQNILRKLGATSRLEAAAIAVRAGFVPLIA